MNRRHFFRFLAAAPLAIAAAPALALASRDVVPRYEINPTGLTAADERWIAEALERSNRAMRAAMIAEARRYDPRER